MVYGSDGSMNLIHKANRLNFIVGLLAIILGILVIFSAYDQFSGAVGYLSLILLAGFIESK